MTNADAVARARDMIAAIGTLSDGLAQYNAAQTRHYIASLYELGRLEQSQFYELMAATVKALNDWETHHAAMNADGRLND
jgi:DNA-binding transcriptional regulator YiaG